MGYFKNFVMLFATIRKKNYPLFLRNKFLYFILRSIYWNELIPRIRINKNYLLE